MSYIPYHPETDLPATGNGQSGPGVAPAGRTGAGGGPGDADLAAAGSAAHALRLFTAGVRGGAGPGEFRAGIEAGHRVLGNRAFMHCVGMLQPGGRGAVEQGMTAPLQLMGKKKKKPGAGPPEPIPKEASPVLPTAPQAPVKPVGAGSSCGTQGQAGAGKQGVREAAEIAPAKSEFNRREIELFSACIKGGTGRFRRFLRHGNVDANISDNFGTLLCHAAYGGNTAIARELLSMPGIDVNLAQQEGATPLYLAAQLGHVRIVELLLAVRGINVNLTTKAGATPLHIAAQRGCAEIVKLLLAACGINVNAVMPDNNATPLILAIYLGHEDVAALLLEAPDVDVNIPLDNGIAPVHLAARYNFPALAGQLVRRGADVNLPVSGGITPLYFTAESGHLEVARTLLQAPDIRVNQAAGIRYVPLGVAAERADKDMVRLLLRNGADPNIKSANGLTPLHVACLHGQMAIVEMLLHAGADMDAEVEDPEGESQTQTPYSLARLGGHQGVVSVLAAQRRHREAAPPRLEQLPVPGEPDRTAQTPASHEAASLPVIAADTPVKRASSTSPAARESQVMAEQDAAAETTDRVSAPSATPVPPDKAGTVTRQAARIPPVQAKDALRQEVLGKLRAENLDPLEGIRLLEDVNAAHGLDALCSLYTRLAHIERRKERARRSRRRREMLSVSLGPAPVAAGAAAAPLFTLGKKTGLDADAVEGEIKRYLDRNYQRFVSQAVNDMEFGRGKPTAGYPGLWHASAGIAGVGSCSVFYYVDGPGETIRVAGIGHHVGRAAYRLDYASAELDVPGRILCIA